MMWPKFVLWVSMLWSLACCEGGHVVRVGVL